MNTIKSLHETALKAPPLSGVYLWKNAEEKVLYVGKAKNLKNRLKSYFSGKKDIKTRTLLSRAAKIETIICSNEYEALILENTLIKQYSPQYNISLKDDKSYPLIRITNEDFPRIFKTRRIVKDGSLYFGPYPNGSALQTFLELIYKNYPLRRCKTLRKRKSPCLYYHIGRCSAPCCDYISKEAYRLYIDEITAFLEGKPSETLEKISVLMKAASKELHFEKAAQYRDLHDSLSHLLRTNLVTDSIFEDRDYIHFAFDQSFVQASILKMRDGKMVEKDSLRVKSIHNHHDAGSLKDLAEEFLRSYYEEKDAPQYIYLPIAIDTKLYSEYLTKTKKMRIQVFSLVPKPEEVANNLTDEEKSEEDELAVAFDKPHYDAQSRHRAILDLAEQNAKEDLRKRLSERGDFAGMEDLKEILKLEKLPLVIEGFDISHLDGHFTVASMVQFYKGKNHKKEYRYFTIKSLEKGKIDDYHSLKEASARRYSRLLNENLPFPDLILIDGGKGQLHAVEAILKALEIDIPLVALAEKNEEIYVQDKTEPLRLPSNSPARLLLQRIRDEAHRFAQRNVHASQKRQLRDE